MARGVAKTPEERIADIESKKGEYQARIEHYKTKISELDGQIKELRDAQQKEKLNELLQAIQASGKTVDEVLSTISNS